jgi:peroxiredoxin
VTAAGLGLLLALGGTACGGQRQASASSHQDAPDPGVRTEHAAAPAPAVATIDKPAPEFVLKDTSGKTHKLSDYTAAGKLVVLEWFNPDCPIAKAYHQPENKMVALATEFKGRGVVWLAVNSGAEGKQGAGIERNTKALSDYGITFPVLMDPTGEVGHRYAAKTTPHMYVIDTHGVLRYAGAIDSGDPSKKGDVNYVKRALEEILAGKDVTTTTSKPFGCSVKYGS